MRTRILHAQITGAFDLAAEIKARPDQERAREIVRLRLASPKRGAVPQSDADDCPLFIAANEPGLF